MSEELHMQPLPAHTQQLLIQVAHHFLDQRQQAYLVGGSVRNLLLQEPCIDWDIATTGDVPKLARQLADKLDGFYAHLHEKASRVIVKSPAEVIFDVAPLHGASIEEDLNQRDFTINALAIPLDIFLQHLTSNKPLTIIDTTSGLADLHAHRLRAVHKYVFQDDPLRMLRAIRFLMCYHLHLDEQTEALIKRDAPLLLKTAPERIHEEMYAILRPGGGTQRLRFMDQLGLLTRLMPEFEPARAMSQPELHHWDVLEHSLEAVGFLEHLTHELESLERAALSSIDIRRQGDLAKLSTLLHEAEQQGIFSFANLTTPVMKLAALLHDIGKPVTYTVDENGSIHFYHHPQAGVPLAGQIMQRMSASTHDRRLVQQVVANHMRPGQLSGDIVTPRAIRRYFVDLGPVGISVALVALSDHLAMRGPQALTEHWARQLATVTTLIHTYVRERQRIMPPRLLQPDELMHRLKLEPGPLIGQLLEQIAEAQAEGIVHSREDALWFAQEKLQQNSSSERLS